jgi:hypothetical protein
LEFQATEAVKRLTEEEKRRLRNIQKFLDENRPMQQRDKSALGLVETVVVGIVRAPILLYQIFIRVKNLLESEPLDDMDAEILRKTKQKDGSKKENRN